MNQHITLRLRHVPAVGLLACLLISGFAGAALILIDPVTNNGSFEFVNGAPKSGNNGDKVTGWNSAAPNNIDNWSLWSGPNNDSGIQVWSNSPPPPPAGPTGIWFAFLQQGNSIYNLTTYTIEAGDTFTFSWDNIGTRQLSHSVSLVYFDGISVLPVPGTTVSVTGTPSGQRYGGMFTIPEDSPAIGYTVGLGLINTSTFWLEVDNFNLSVEPFVPVPEPATTAFVIAVTLGGLGIARQVSRRART